MVLCRVVFAGIGGSIENTFSPKIFELALCVAAFQPVEPLAIQFGCLWRHGTHCETLCSDVVSGDGSWGWLGMPHILECDADGGSLFASIIKSGKFRF